jgi:hypothetical protein
METSSRLNDPHVLLDRVKAIRRSRRAAASTLRNAILDLESKYTEAELASRWMARVRHEQDILPFGWYQPPPDGVSVLIGKAPEYARLNYGSLRDEANWPSPTVSMSPEAIVYPYFSAVDKRTGMIGDFVGTFYSGPDPTIRSWISEVYAMTMRIVEFATIGNTISDVYDFAQVSVSSLGGTNNTLSLTKGGSLGADIGHTVPGFSGAAAGWLPRVPSRQEAARKISAGRSFVNAENDARIDDGTAFTIEPQVVRRRLPMVSFHVIVAFAGGEKHVIDEFAPLFDLFNMTSWLYGVTDAELHEDGTSGPQ